MTSIDKPRLETWRSNERRKGKKPTTVNRDIAALKAVLSKAAEWEILEKHPLAKLKPIKTDPYGTGRTVTDEEEARLRTVLHKRDEEMRLARARYNEHLAQRHQEPMPPLASPFADHLEPLILLLLNSGMRFGEATKLRHRDVNLRDRFITVTGATAKSGKTWSCPVSVDTWLS
jgi:integrase